MSYSEDNLGTVMLIPKQDNPQKHSICDTFQNKFIRISDIAFI